MTTIQQIQSIKDLKLPLERDSFMRNVIRELSGLLEDMVGIDETEGFISVVGQHIGTQINENYQLALNTEKFSQDQVIEILADLKHRIKGSFVVEEQSDKKIVFSNKDCPFAEEVKGRTSLCMMTSNVFGVIAADNLGYAKIALEKTIAKGNPECRVAIYLDANSEDTQSIEGREYFQAEKL